MPSSTPVTSFHPPRDYVIDPNTGSLGPRAPTPNQAFENENENNYSEESPENASPNSTRSDITIGTGIFLGLALIVATIVIPIYLVPALTAKTAASTVTYSTTTTSDTSTTTSTSATTSTTTSTTSTTSTTRVTMYVPSNYFTPCSYACTNVTTTTPSTLLAAWNFENNLLDSTGNYNGAMTTGTTYIPGYVNQALAVSSAQYVTVGTYLNLNSRSFTIEAWIFVAGISSSYSYGIIGQCQTTSVRQCLYCVIRSNRLYMGFFSDDVIGSTTVPTNIWVHTAFTYDYSSNTKSVYINGVLDGSITSGGSYQGTSGYTYIGYATDSVTIQPLPGYIDQVTVSNRAKTACEILNDASLVSRFSFEGAYSDAGPNNLPSYITLQGNSGMSYVSGRVSQGLSLANTNSFFQSCSYYSISYSGQAFSFSIWINPTVIGGTIIHTSNDRSGSGTWCLPVLGFSINGSIVAQSWMGSVVSIFGPQLPVSNWTHVAQTWSATNGFRLYINGALYGSATMPNYNANNQVNFCIFLGTSGFGINCQTSNIVMGSYSGIVDEFYVYNREITATEVCSLAHP